VLDWSRLRRICEDNIKVDFQETLVAMAGYCEHRN
jgi:hypothetical protein